MISKIFLSVLLAMAFLPHAEGRSTRASNKLIAAVIQDSDGHIQVWINIYRVWVEEGRLTDSYGSEANDEKVQDLALRANLCGVQESIFEPCEVYSDRKQRTPREIARDLNQVGIQIDPEFQKWAQEEVQ